MHQRQAVALVDDWAPPEEGPEARSTMSWSLRRVLPPEVEAVAVLQLERGERIIAAIEGEVLYRFAPRSGREDGPSAVEYSVTCLTADKGHVRATVSYRHDQWSGPVAATQWSFYLDHDDVLSFTTTHPVYAHPEGAEELARRIAGALGRPVHGQPSDR
jgi:hypothetical protein